MNRYTDNTPRVEKQIGDVCRRTAELVAEELLRAANETVPFDTGTLAASGTVIPHPTKAAATIVYTAPYAARQHEDLTLRHTSGRRAMWLTRTADEQADRLAKAAAQLIRGAL